MAASGHGLLLRQVVACAWTLSCSQEISTNYVLKCNINNTVNHLNEGIALGLKDDREKISEALGRSAVFKGDSLITKLPPFLTVQVSTSTHLPCSIDVFTSHLGHRGVCLLWHACWHGC